MMVRAVSSRQWNLSGAVDQRIFWAAPWKMAGRHDGRQIGCRRPQSVKDIPRMTRGRSLWRQSTCQPLHDRLAKMLQLNGHGCRWQLGVCCAGCIPCLLIQPGSAILLTGRNLACCMTTGEGRGLSGTMGHPDKGEKSPVGWRSGLGTSPM